MQFDIPLKTLCLMPQLMMYILDDFDPMSDDPETEGKCSVGYCAYART